MANTVLRGFDHRRLRLILGFLGATAFLGLYPAIFFLLAGQWYLALRMIDFSFRITVPPAVVVALPLYWWLSRTGRLTIYWAAIVGCATGAAFSLVGILRRIWLFGSFKTPVELWHEILAYEEPHIFIVIGIFCGLVGWLIAFGPRLRAS
jgi:hypothetical protein